MSSILTTQGFQGFLERTPNATCKYLSNVDCPVAQYAREVLGKTVYCRIGEAGAEVVPPEWDQAALAATMVANLAGGTGHLPDGRASPAMYEPRKTRARATVA